MTTFLQLHLLTAYPASNLNRDDTGSPKTLKFGGADRLRVSSQSLKRAIRTSDHFAAAMGDAIGVPTPVFDEAIGMSLGVRSKSIVGAMVKEVMKSKGGLDEVAVLEQVKAALAKAKAKEASEEDEDDADDEGAKKGKGKTKKGAGKLSIGSIDTKRPMETNEAVILGPDEMAKAMEIARRIANGEDVDPKRLTVLLERPKAADIAMFGRMLADNPGYNVEAAVQVAHAFTTHRVTIEDDYYTAVDDLKARDRTEDRGAGFIGIQEYGAGLFYLYVCIDADLLARNLSDDTKLARAATKAFIEAACTVSPKGKQNSYASRSRALYAMVERGPDAPRTLAAAFMKPIAANGEADVAAQSIKALEDLREQFAHAYGDAGEHEIMNVTAGKGTLAEIVTFALEAFDGRAA